MDLVPRGIDPLSDIHHSATGFDRVEHARNSKNMGTREPGGHHAPGPILIDSSRRPMQTTNRQFMTRFVEFINTADPRLATGDVIAARFTMRGTHRGAFFGVPPTGKAIAVQALNVYHAFPRQRLVQRLDRARLRCVR
jgi:predicted ester cyclase